MAARKRKDTESFEKYRENLKKEDLLLKEYLKGRIWWSSSYYGQYAHDPFIKGKYGKLNKDRYDKKRDS